MADAWACQPVRDDPAHALPVQVFSLAALPQPADRCQNLPMRAPLSRTPKSRVCPTITARRYWPGLAIDRCMRLRRSSLTACSLARSRLALVIRKTMNSPFRVLPQQCIKPRKAKASAMLCPRQHRFSRAKGSHSINCGLVLCSASPKPFSRASTSRLSAQHWLGARTRSPSHRIAQDDHVAFGVATPPLLNPQSASIVPVAVGQQRADTPALYLPQITTSVLPILQHAHVQPFAALS
jgi:hypothetical protein